MINAGIIGLGPVWEERYRSALDSLAQKVRVTAIYDGVEERAAIIAKSLGADCVTGIQLLCRRTDIDVVFILGNDWTNLPALKFLCEARKPAYIAGSLGHEIPTIGEIHLLALSEGLIFVPEFSRRYTPATIRLRELIATRIGEPQQILLQGRLPDTTDRESVPGQSRYEDFLIGLFDWCYHLMGLPPLDVLAQPLSENEQTGFSSYIRFGSPDGSPEQKLHATVTIADTGQPGEAQPEDSQPWALMPGEVTARVITRNGEATIRGTNKISWNDRGTESVEILSTDRPETEVMLDLFLRRVEGALVPVANLADICRAINIFRAHEGSRATGKPVLVPGIPANNPDSKPPTPHEKA